jgi:hypothetical protein
MEAPPFIGGRISRNRQGTGPSCWTPGEHEIRVLAQACDTAGPDFNDEKIVTVTVPEAKVSIAALTKQGQTYTASINYEVPFATASTPKGL